MPWDWGAVGSCDTQDPPWGNSSCQEAADGATPAQTARGEAGGTGWAHRWPRCNHRESGGILHFAMSQIDLFLGSRKYSYEEESQSVAQKAGGRQGENRPRVYSEV